MNITPTLLYQVQQQSGEVKHLYFLFEHKSYPDQLVSLQILRYMLRIWEQRLSDGAKPPLTPIFTIVVYHGRKPWNISPQFSSLIDVESEWQAYTPDFKYHLHDLTVVPLEDIVGPNVLRATLQILKHIFDPDLAQQLPKVLGYFTELVHQRDILDFLVATLRYISGANPHVSRTQVENIVLNTFPNRGGDYANSRSRMD